MFYTKLFKCSNDNGAILGRIILIHNPRHSHEIIDHSMYEILHKDLFAELVHDAITLRPFSTSSIA